MNLTELYNKAMSFEFLSAEEGVYLFEKVPLAELMFVIRTWLMKSLTWPVPNSKVPSGLKLIFDLSSKLPKLFLNSMLPLAV